MQIWGGVIVFAYGMYSCYSIIYWKEYPSSTELLLHLCQKSFGHVYLFLGSLLWSVDLYVYPLVSATLSWLLCIVSLNIQKMLPLILFFFKTVLAFLGPFPNKFYSKLVYVCKPIDQIEGNRHLVESYNPWIWWISPVIRSPLISFHFILSSSTYRSCTTCFVRHT